jgi:hypothetical protein
MIKNYILFFCFLISITVKAQTSIYHPFPEYGAVWNQIESWFDGTCDGTSNYSIFFGSDTTIGANVYHKLKKSGYEYSTTCGGGGYFYYDSIALIRQDIASKKVYYYCAGVDSILYDFNLQIGDTLNATKVHWGYYIPDVVVSSIDSVVVFGNYRKRFNFNSNLGFNSCPDTSIIEGIGSTAGLFTIPSNCFESYAWLTCFSQVSDTSAMCTIISKVENIDNKQMQVLIYPNPIQSNTTLVCNFTLKNTELKIWDSFGRNIINRKINNSLYPLDFEFLSQGIYFYQVVNDDREVGQGKLMVSGQF